MVCRVFFAVLVGVVIAVIGADVTTAATISAATESTVTTTAAGPTVQTTVATTSAAEPTVQSTVTTTAAAEPTVQSTVTTTVAAESTVQSTATTTAVAEPTVQSTATTTAVANTTTTETINSTTTTDITSTTPNTTEVTTSSTVSTTPKENCTTEQKRLACDLLQKHGKNLVLAKAHASGVTDNAFASNNLNDMCEGKQATRSSYKCKECPTGAPGGTVCIAESVLKYVAALAAKGRVKVNELAGACHSCTSKHYQGLAVDLDDGKRDKEFLDACRQMGGTGIDEKSHIHCHFNN